ncbi:helix-turn-helix domain-containing protein [Neobacillus vireti]|uniref:helix-turn-helix domain-containing protein n=1 Tax=Neobacillus vireti TaxID=220686 RepID=UPI003000C9F6
MSKRQKYILDPPTEQTIRRMMEVEFYLAFRHIQSLEYGDTADGASDLIGGIAKLCGVERYILYFPYRELTTFGGTPSKKEIVITLYFYGVSYRDIYRKFGVHSDTIRKIIRGYIKSGQPPLKPHLGLNFQQELILALEVLDKTLLPLITPLMVISEGKKVRKLWLKEEIN